MSPAAWPCGLGLRLMRRASRPPSAAACRATDIEPFAGNHTMSKLRAGLIQMALKASTDADPETIRQAMIAAHILLIEQAGEQGVQVLCFQEVFTQPYFCPSQDAKWRSEEHTSELQSLMRISYAVFCLKKKKTT